MRWGARMKQVGTSLFNLRRGARIFLATDSLIWAAASLLPAERVIKPDVTKKDRVGNSLICSSLFHSKSLFLKSDGERFAHVARATRAIRSQSLCDVMCLIRAKKRAIRSKNLYFRLFKTGFPPFKPQRESLPLLFTLLKRERLERFFTKKSERSIHSKKKKKGNCYFALSLTK